MQPAPVARSSNQIKRQVDHHFNEFSCSSDESGNFSDEMEESGTNQAIFQSTPALKSHSDQKSSLSSLLSAN